MLRSRSFLTVSRFLNGLAVSGRSRGFLTVSTWLSPRSRYGVRLAFVGFKQGTHFTPRLAWPQPATLQARANPFFETLKNLRVPSRPSRFFPSQPPVQRPTLTAVCGSPLVGVKLDRLLGPSNSPPKPPPAPQASSTMTDQQQFLKNLDSKLWTAADKLRSNLDAAVYKHAVLGLIFLKYVSATSSRKPSAKT